jgi:hypothetical protein
MIDAKELQRIAEAAEGEVDRWSDARFGGVDLPGHQAGRDFQTKNVGTDTDTDPRFSPIDDRGSAHSIRTAVEQLARDPQIREQIAHETGNADELERIQEEQAETAVWEFRRRNPSYFKSQLNWERMVASMAQKWLGWIDADEIEPDEAYAELARRGYFTSDNLTLTFKALSRAGALEVNPDALRPLTEHDKRAIALQAASGDIEGAVTRYLQLRLPQLVSELWMYSTSHQDALDSIADPAYEGILREAVWFCWENGRANYAPTAERRNFMRQYIANRIPTARLLDMAWAACQEAEKDAARSGVLGQLNEQNAPEDTAKKLDALDDASVDRLYHQTLREYAKTAKPVGMLL